MNTILPLLLILLLSACTTTRPAKESQYEPPTQVPDVPLQDRLGMRRAVDDLGFAEKRFSSCDNTAGGLCKPRYFSVVHFQLLCRDSEGTVSDVPSHLTPLTSGRVLWQISGLNGNTRTDSKGFGQLAVVSERSLTSQRLILRIGKQFMGFTVSEVSKVVLPQNFCI